LFSKTHSYSTLAINLKLFAHLRVYFFKAQIDSKMRNANCATLKKP